MAGAAAGAWVTVSSGRLPAVLSSADLAVTNTFAPLDQLPDVSEISAPKRITNLLIPSLETAEIPEALNARSGQLFPSVVLIDETLI